jgi:hypothetical protein
VRLSRRFALMGCCGSLSALGACGASSSGSDAESPEEEDGRPPTEDDRTLCGWRGRTDVEVTESRGPGSKFANVRRVFIVAGAGEERRRILVCREIDTNLDGIKDVARYYDELGKGREEHADANYDGHIDTWIQFAAGRVGRVEVDSNGDGTPDERWFYVRGVLSRVQRDVNRDGQPDVWEIYREGKLERIGVDLDADGHVDRWDRDEVARRVAELKEREQAGDDGTEPAPVDPAAKKKEAEAAADKDNAPSEKEQKGTAPSESPESKPRAPAPQSPAKVPALKK